MTDSPSPLPAIPPRDPQGHKGTFGTVAIVGGCAHTSSFMLGGPCISAVAALRSGAGLARLALPRAILAEGLVVAPSATGVALPTKQDKSINPSGAARVIDGLLETTACIAVGPGLGAGEGPEAVTLRLIGQQRVPVVVDADAINALAEIPELTKEFRAHAVLTPHPGEYRRLAASLKIDIDPADPPSRIHAAESLAQRLGCVVALKGAHTVVSDGHKTWVCDLAPNPALATAGTGDALTGVIASLIAQFHRSPILAGERTVTSEARGGLSLLDCASLGVRAHAMAGAAWVAASGADAGMLAMELCDHLPQAIQALRG